ncbi:hypothetical protein DSO57_1002014 [Entomophthora muscae]|uniref:Uncharacterized protein n=1 Tax=Entomophthora muscae TaxID=34485 RepID=A0ACC2RNV0_9FUNG|nr:hypothetical protein DSO57_1002014 [Entomophthora muscae]
MAPPLTPQPNYPINIHYSDWLSRLCGAKLYFLLMWSLSYIIKVTPILWWALSTGPAVSHPKSPNASIYAWLSEILPKSHLLLEISLFRWV